MDPVSRDLRHGWRSLRRAPGLTTLIVVSLAVVDAGLAMGPSVLCAQSATIFDRYSRSVYKVEILEQRSSSPSIVGTSFVADSAGSLITNYHVVKNVVFEPGDYRVRLVGTDGDEVDSVRVVRVDAARDLAVLRAAIPDTVPLRFADGVPDVGDPVFSLGFPLNLSGTVVAGSFNGRMPNSLEGMFHFTGSLNPGMSGGPTMLGDGRVVGVNVATSGNQLSYLVPAARARDLLTKPARDDPDLLGDVVSSLRGAQEGLREAVLGPGMVATEIEGFRLPKPPGDLFECSASPLHPAKVAYEGVLYRCSLSDRFGLDPDDSSSPILFVEHVVLWSKDLLETRFNNVYSSWFNTLTDGQLDDSDWATKYRCKTGNFHNDSDLKVRVVQCWRRRPDLPGLYDVFVRTAILGVGHDGVVSTYRMDGTTRENGLSLIRQALKLTGRIK
jgi:Trypsin-like peptidase domain